MSCKYIVAYWVHLHLHLNVHVVCTWPSLFNFKTEKSAMHTGSFSINNYACCLTAGYVPARTRHTGKRVTFLVNVQYAGSKNFTKCGARSGSESSLDMLPIWRC